MRSRTAEAAAVQRVAHAWWDDPPKVFVDHEVLPLLPASTRLWLRMPGTVARLRMRMRTPASIAMAQIRGQIVVRARHAEDLLERSVERGVSQYVILAAGLDTFALRRTDLKRSLQVFEVDQVDTQRHKRRRLGARAPANLKFVGVDFERQQVGDALLRRRFDPDRLAFFSWLGTTYYLTQEAIWSTLKSVRKVAANGSELVFDYWSRTPDMNWQAQLLLAGVRAAVALQREPMLSFFSPAQIERDVARLGFDILENLSPSDQRARYLPRRKDGLDVPDFAHLLHIRIP